MTGSQTFLSCTNSLPLAFHNFEKFQLFFGGRILLTNKPRGNATQMGMLNPLKSLVVTRNWSLILFSEILLLLHLIKPISKKYHYSKSMLIFPIASAFDELVSNKFVFFQK